MVALAFNGDFLPTNALYARYCTNGDAGLLKNGPLLNVKFHKGMRSETRAWCCAVVSDSLKFISDASAVDADRVKCFFDTEAAYVHN